MTRWHGELTSGPQQTIPTKGHTGAPTRGRVATGKKPSEDRRRPYGCPASRTASPTQVHDRRNLGSTT